MNVEAIPAELRERDQWVLWRYEDRDGDITKVPYRVREPFVRASSTDPTTWASFELAISVMDQADGIGFVFSIDDPFVGLDLDKGLSETDRAAIMVALRSYAETSISGTGVHVIVKASLNGYGRNRKGPFEVYDAGRYFVVTGDHIRGMPTTIEERQAQLEEVLAEFLPELEERCAVDGTHHSGQPVDLNDQELLDRMFASKSGKTIRELWAGDISNYPSQSEADQALCNYLAFWTNRDAARMASMFRRSQLHREEGVGPNYAKSIGYLARTIETAISATPEGYQPRRSDQSQGSDSVDSDRGFLGAVEANGVGESVLIDSPTPDAAAPVDVGTDPSQGSDSDSVDSERTFALPIREFIALEREHREPMLSDADGRAAVGLLSLVIVGALGGHGKTTWGLDLFLHMAAGVDYPPFTVPRPVSILIIENEGPEQLFADKLEARLEHFPHELKANLDVCTFDWGGFSLADPTHRERLTLEISEKGYDLVFGDPLDSLGIEGVGSPEDTRKFLALMKQTGLNKTVAWWLNTHPRKEETKEALDEISGAWGGKPDSVFLLRMLEGDRTQVRQPKLRWARRGKGPTLLFAFDPDTEAFSYIGDQSEEERDYLAEIREHLKNGKWQLVKEIAAPVEAAGIGANDKTVKKVLEEHPDVFESRTGDEAKALGRKPQATVWQLRSEDEDE